jgi:hypothetical protein
MAHLSPPMHFIVTQLSVRGNAYYVGDIKYLLL